MERNLIEIHNLCFSRGSREIFRGIDLTVRRGQVTAIMGPSGTGKTTLLRLIGGQLYPDQGSVVVAGQNVHVLNRKALFQLRKQMGLLFQGNALFTDMSVFDNIAFPLREHTQLSEAMIYNIVLMKLELVGLRGAHRLMPNQLSGGMARRVGLARTIALDPGLIMYDEPLTGQDPITKGMVTKLIRLLNDALNIASLVVSHDVKETLEIADYVYVLSEGRVIGEGEPEKLLKHGSEQVQQFLRGLPDGPIPFHFPAEDYAVDMLQGALK